MLHVLFLDSKPVHVTSESPYTGTPKLKDFPGIKYNKVQSRWDWKSHEQVVKLAEMLTKMTGKLYLGTDAGESTSPRYDIKEAPCVGDKVSRSFNGDSYPCGEIVKITPTWQITTSDGTQFRRYKQSGGWRQTGRGFWMIGGHVDERNPHF
jgi:hypothetical protein